MAEDLIISSEVVARIAERLAIQPEALRAWFRLHVDTVKAIRNYINTEKVVTPSLIEANAIPGQPIDPALVEQVLVMLEEGRLIERMVLA